MSLWAGLHSLLTKIVRGQQTTTFSQTSFKCPLYKTSMHFALLLTENQTEDHNTLNPQCNIYEQLLKPRIRESEAKPTTQPDWATLE